MTEQQPWDVCATEGCGKRATKYFEAYGIGSYYCDDCGANVTIRTTKPEIAGEIGTILAAFPNIGLGPIDKTAYSAALRKLVEFSRRGWVTTEDDGVSEKHSLAANTSAGGVKTLEWYEGDGPSDLWAGSFCGSYHIMREHGAYLLVVPPGGAKEALYETLSEAKAAAQAEFNQRIISSLHPADGEPVAFQARVAQAHVALFHDDPTDIAERRDRFFEEATEAVQSLGMTEEDAHALVAYTFSRSVGEPEKEIGAAALTLASLCVEAGYDMMACAEADLAALVTPEKIAKVRAKRATRHGRGPLPGFDHSRPSNPVSAEVTLTDDDIQLGIAWLNGSVGSAEPGRLKQAADKILAALASLNEVG